MQHAASNTTTVPPSSHNQRHVLIGKQWYQLPELIPTNSSATTGDYQPLISVSLKKTNISQRNAATHFKMWWDFIRYYNLLLSFQLHLQCIDAVGWAAERTSGL